MGKETQLLEASVAGNLSKVEQLLENKSRLKRILSSEKALNDIAEGEDDGGVDSLKIIGKKRAPHLDIDVRDDNGASSLILAALNGHRDVVHTLLTYSASVFAVDNQGNTALHLAAWHNRSDIVELLLANDAVIDVVNREGNTALHYACQYCPPGKTLTIVKLLQWSEKSIIIPNRAGDTPFSLSIRFNKKEAVSLLVDAEVKTLKETKSIIEASKNGRTEIVEILLDAGMDPNCFDGSSGSCPLHEAVRFFRKDTAKVLLEFGATCDQMSANGETAIDIAREHPAAIRVDFLRMFVDFKKETPRIPKSLLEKTQAASQNEGASDVYITYPLLKNKQDWTRQEQQYCSAWTKQHPHTCLLDNDRSTYWKIPAAGAYNFVAFDLGSEYTLTGIRLAGWSDKQMVHAFNIEVATSLTGPWKHVQKYKADSIGPEDMSEFSECQDFRGFFETAQCWKIIIADNFGAPTTCLSEIQFFGVEDGVLKWFEQIDMKHLIKSFILKGYNQLSEIALLDRSDLHYDVPNEEEMRRMLHAISILKRTHYPPKNLSWAVPPSAKVIANKRLPDFIVYSEIYSTGDLKLTVKGGAILGGNTIQPLISKHSGFPPKCTFSGINIGPSGQYVLEVQSLNDASVMIKSEPIVVTPPAMRQSEIGQVFDDLDKLLQF